MRDSPKRVYRAPCLQWSPVLGRVRDLGQPLALRSPSSPNRSCFINRPQQHSLGHDLSPRSFISKIQFLIIPSFLTDIYDSERVHHVSVACPRSILPLSDAHAFITVRPLPTCDSFPPSNAMRRYYQYARNCFVKGPVPRGNKY